MPGNTFIERWQNSAAAERANYALFLSELCDYLEVPRPEPAVSDSSPSHYVFEHPVTFRHPTGLISTGFIDLYKRGCSFWTDSMAAAGIPKNYCHAGRPGSGRGRGRANSRPHRPPSLAVFPAGARPRRTRFLLQSPTPVPSATVARGFIRARTPDVSAILETLAALGQAKNDEGRFHI